MEAENWTGCYEGGWNGVIVPEAFAHPAKFSYNLTQRMFYHASAKGWLKLGDVVADPFGGVGCGGIVAAYSDIQWVGCELEQKFVDLAKENFELHRRKWEKLGSPQPKIIQGDSRKLASLIGQVECVVSSPPFSVRQPPAELAIGPNLSKTKADTYGQTPGQLGAMKPGTVDAVVGSPPFQGSQPQQDKGFSAPHDSTRNLQNSQYATTPGNLGNLKEGSIDAVVSSPPFEAAQTGGGIAAAQQGKSDYPIAKNLKTTGSKNQGYQAQGETEGQLGNDKGPTFWQAAHEIVEQCHKILRPGGHAIWVVKAFVRNGKRVDFPGDWRRLCESVGFSTVCVHHAMLVKEETHDGLFGDIKEKTERKSFFRRLAESKGSPAIDYEVVLCMERDEHGS